MTDAKTASRPAQPTNPCPAEMDGWCDLYWRAFGAKGLAVLAWWTGSLFAQQLRERQRSYPLMSTVGVHVQARRLMLEILHALVDQPGDEGADPAFAPRPTLVQMLYSQINRPVVFSTRQGPRVRGLVAEEIKQCYRAGPVRVLGQHADGHQVRQFRAGLLLSQTDSLLSDPGYAVRMLEVDIQPEEFTVTEARAADRLWQQSCDGLAYYVPLVQSCSADLVDMHSRQAPEHFDAIRQATPGMHERVAYNHAQLAGLLDLLTVLLPVGAQQHTAALAEVYGMATRANAALTVEQGA